MLTDVVNYAITDAVLSDLPPMNVYQYAHKERPVEKERYVIMKQLQVVVLFTACSFASAVPAWAQEEASALASEQGNDPINAVVKLEVTTAKSDVHCPWINHTASSTGSGVVIDKGRILTCAHCVADATYIRVRKQNEDTLYHAQVLFMDDDADLALVSVADPKFMADVTPLEIGETPHVQDDVLAVGDTMRKKWRVVDEA